MMMKDKNPIQQILQSILMAFLAILFSCCGGQRSKNEAGKDWPGYLGGNSRNHYSPLKQIDKSNVAQLKVAWEYHTGDDVAGDNTQIQCNPIIINGIMYGTSPKLKVFALNASTGKELWQFNPDAKVSFSMNVNRGVTYWNDGDDQRILFTAGSTLFALSAKNGTFIQSFWRCWQSLPQRRFGGKGSGFIRGFHYARHYFQRPFDYWDACI